MAKISGGPEMDQYTVAWIGVLPVESAAAQAMQDETYEVTHRRDPDDHNVYSFGRIAKHNVVFASLPAGEKGTTPALKVASDMTRTYKSIKVRLLVGIGGGVPGGSNDIRLGDVVISQPVGTFGGVVQYDQGKKYPNGKFKRTGRLDKPPRLLLNALSSVQADIESTGFDVEPYITEHLQSRPYMLEKYTRPHGSDYLFRSDYEHVEGNKRCNDCVEDQMVPRKNRKSHKKVKFHYGTIASANYVIRDGEERDRISKDLAGVLCFEMEAAGLMDDFSCLVIRGISDYADSHKNDKWRRYAALTAACYAKKLLSKIPAEDIKQQPPIYSVMPFFPVYDSSQPRSTHHDGSASGRLLEYPNTTAGQSTSEGTSSYLLRPPLVHNRYGHGDSELTWSRDNSPLFRGTRRRPMSPAREWVGGYRRATQMVSENTGRPSYPSHSQSMLTVPRRPPPRPLQDQPNTVISGVQFPQSAYRPNQSGEYEMEDMPSTHRTNDGHERIPSTNPSYHSQNPSPFHQSLPRPNYSNPLHNSNGYPNSDDQKRLQRNPYAPDYNQQFPDPPGTYHNPLNAPYHDQHDEQYHSRINQSPPNDHHHGQETPPYPTHADQSDPNDIYPNQDNDHPFHPSHQPYLDDIYDNYHDQDIHHNPSPVHPSLPKDPYYDPPLAHQLPPNHIHQNPNNHHRHHPHPNPDGHQSAPNVGEEEPPVSPATSTAISQSSEPEESESDSSSSGSSSPNSSEGSSISDGDELRHHGTTHASDYDHDDDDDDDEDHDHDCRCCIVM